MLHLKILFIYCLWLYWVFTAAQPFSLPKAIRDDSSCGVWASHCSGFSCCKVRDQGHVGFSSCSSWALAHRLNS